MCSITTKWSRKGSIKFYGFKLERRLLVCMLTTGWNIHKHCCRALFYSEWKRLQHAGWLKCDPRICSTWKILKHLVSAKTKDFTVSLRIQIRKYFWLNKRKCRLSSFSPARTDFSHPNEIRLQRRINRCKKGTFSLRFLAKIPRFENWS